MEAIDSKFDKLNEIQKNLVLEFAGIMNIDEVDTSISYLELSNFDINFAIEKYLKREQFEKKPDFPFKINRNPVLEEKKENSQIKDNFEEIVNEYKVFLLEKEKKKPILSSISLFDKLKRTTTASEQFLKEIQQKFGKFETFNFLKGNFFQTLQASSKNKKLLLVYIHLENHVFNEIELKLLKDKPLIEYTNLNFDMLGMLATSDEAVKVIKQFIQSKEWPGFACFRLNLFDKPQLLEFINIRKSLNEIEYYKKRFEDLLNNLKFIEEEENEIKKRSLPKKPKSEKDQKLDKEREKEREAQKKAYLERKALIIEQKKIKADEDRMLRQMQEEKYNEVEKMMKEQEESKQREEKLKLQKELEQIQIIELEKVHKAKKLQELSQEPKETEPNLIKILFRLPNGLKLSRRFQNLQEIQIMFDFIECQDDIGLENSNKFNIIRTNPFIDLLGKENLKFEEVFEGSDQEVLYVKEID